MSVKLWQDYAGGHFHHLKMVIWIRHWKPWGRLVTSWRGHAQLWRVEGGRNLFLDHWMYNEKSRAPFELDRGYPTAIVLELDEVKPGSAMRLICPEHTIPSCDHASQKRLSHGRFLTIPEVAAHRKLSFTRRHRVAHMNGRASLWKAHSIQTSPLAACKCSSLLKADLCTRRCERVNVFET